MALLETDGGMRELALFAGAGGGILGGLLLGWRTVCAVELDAYCRRVLMARQDDGSLEPFPIWDDVTTFDGRPWAGLVDVVSGGFPCTDISSAGKGAGIDGDQSGLWKDMARIVGEVRPRFVFVENSPMLTSRGLGTVLGDLAALGFDAEWGVLGAHHVGAPHKRDRIWIAAYSDAHGGRLEVERITQHGELEGARGNLSHGLDSWGRRSGTIAHAADANRDALRHAQQRPPRGRVDVQDGGCSESGHDGAQESMADADSAQCEGRRLSGRTQTQHADVGSSGWWEVESRLGRVTDVVAHRVDRLRAIGNGQVPAVAALAWDVLRERIEGGR